MSDNNNKQDKKQRNFSFGKALKIFSIVLLMVVIISGAALGGIVLSILKDAPEIDPTEVNASLAHTSFIYDTEGDLLEKIEAAEFRTFVELNQIPQHLIDAFIAIEDERFYEHRGVDPKGIMSSVMENIKAGQTVRGASTITQQLVKNVYLTSEKKLSRKITEAYLALQMERTLHKDQILEAYLNRNFFGQNAYGVQEAAQTYFSKDVEDLTIAESALLAGVVKSTTQFQPFIRVRPDSFDSNTQYQVGEADVLGERYILVFNEESVKRQKLILHKMLELEMINQGEYDQALGEDIKLSLNPGQKKTTDITSYFTDYVKTETIETLVSNLGYTREQAEEALFTGGLHIYSTIDLSLQKTLENVYENFTEILTGSATGGNALINWRLSGGNIIDENGKIVFYRQNNLLNEEFDLIIDNGSYHIQENGDIVINSNKLTAYPKHIDITDYYRIDDKNNLLTHTVGSIVIPEDEFSIGENKELTISKKFLDKSEGFYTIDANGNLLISEKYFFRSQDGIVQPQSASVVLDYRNGQIKAIVGGRDVDGNRILNRATDSQRQPGSVIKPLSVYLPALDNGYTAASALDDAPFTKGSWSPRNAYTGFRGIMSLRRSVEISSNTTAAATLDDIGLNTSMSYLAKMGIIDKENPDKDSFVSSAESPDNDENLPALALGGMTDGLTPLEVTAAFGAIANDGVFIEPIAFTKILDKDGNLLIDNTPQETTVVSPQIAYIMKDILRTTVTNGFTTNARMSNMAVAGKTGTTQDRADIWFVGFTPYYVSGVWIGNDSPKITLNKGSETAAKLWQNIMTRAHDGLDGINSFPRPNGIVTANVCSESGLLATSLCTRDPEASITSEIFAQGTAPTQYCDIHVELEVDIDVSTGKIANEYCPDELVETRVFTKDTIPDVCTEHTEFSSTVPDPDEEEEEEEEKPVAPDKEAPVDPDEEEEDSEDENEDDEASNRRIPRSPFRKTRLKNLFSRRN